MKSFIYFVCLELDGCFLIQNVLHFMRRRCHVWRLVFMRVLVTANLFMDYYTNCSVFAPQVSPCFHINVGFI